MKSIIFDAIRIIVIGVLAGCAAALIVYLTGGTVSAQEQEINEMVLEVQSEPSSSTDNTPTILFENIQITDPLPDYVYSMTRKDYIKWAKAQNACAYHEAELIADKFKQRNPYRETYVQRNYGESESVGVMDTGYVDYNAWVERTYYSGASTFTVYKQNAWGGGPVVIINPYAKRPPKVMEYWHDPGKSSMTRYVADPDGVVKNKAEAEEFLEKY